MTDAQYMKCHAIIHGAAAAITKTLGWKAARHFEAAAA